MAVKTFRDGRVKLTGADYTAHKRKVWEAQGRCCAGLCGQHLPFKYAEFDHAAGRGMGGSKRDDLAEGNTVKCSNCHRLRHYHERDLAAAHP